MGTKREAQASDVFRFACDDCSAVLRVRAGSGFDAARTAAGKGWSFVRFDRCPSCTRAATAKPATPKRKASTKR